MGNVRIGVDVGGTFTKAVAIQTQPYTQLAQEVVPTTHTAAEGVAQGVVQALTALLAHPDVPAHDVSLVAHSTTQAVNALLEGDTATVGIVGMGSGRDAMRASRYTNVGDITLAPGKALRTHHVFLDTGAGLTPAEAEHAVDVLQQRGADVIVASEAFSVDDATNEQLVLEAATLRGVPAVAGHQLSGTYGLEVRTITAAINASLLPTMLETAELVEQSLRAADIDAPLMVMRSDGGLTDLDTLRRRPILTLFSGPAASLAGALLAGRVVDGIFLEVGGTSSNLGVIRGGQPQMRYVWVMDYPTCVRSLDVRVQALAGGSMVRSDRRRITDVGPRSAHIAGLPYAGLSPELADVSDVRVELISPNAGDPADYVAVGAPDGRRWALTITCAANALGLVPADSYARGSREAALRGFAALGEHLGCSREEAAHRVIDLAAGRVAKAVKSLFNEYDLRDAAFQLIGGGGGAGALVPAVADRLGVSYHLAEHAPIISSLGDALASVRETAEAPISDAASAEALAQEAEDAAIEAGAEPESIQVVFERDEDRGMLRAVATGHVALAAPITQEPVTEHDARSVAAQAAGVQPSSLDLLVDTDGFRIYRSPRRFLIRAPQTIAVDRGGVVRLQTSGADTVVGSPQDVLAALEQQTQAHSFLGVGPAVRLVVGARLLDLATSLDSNGIVPAAERALLRAPNDASVAAIIER